MVKIKTLEYFRVKPRWLFVKLTDEKGGYGWGEATLEGHSQAVEGTLDEYRTVIVGMEADNIEYIWQKLYRHGFYRGGPVFMSAIAGIDIALWDLKARNLHLPIHALLGGKVRTKLKVYCWIGGDSPSDIRAAALSRKSQNLTTIKMNATSSLDWLSSPRDLHPTLDRLNTVTSLGLDAALDFHGRLHRGPAKHLASLLSSSSSSAVPIPPLFIEEPLLMEHPEALKQFADHQTHGIPVAFGERLYTRWDAKRYLHDSSVDILQPDVSHAGGISEVKRIASMAEAYDVSIAPHCPLGPIALAACMQIGICTQNFVIQEMGLGIHYNAEVEGGRWDLGSYLKGESRGVFEIREGGYVEALEGIGLGIEVDEEVVRRVAGEMGGESWVNGGFVGEDGAIREW
ncbi:MAG: hypothetical protein Q9227_000622 [Pyrenula ochraceoflavens]